MRTARQPCHCAVVQQRTSPLRAKAQARQRSPASARHSGVYVAGRKTAAPSCARALMTLPFSRHRLHRAMNSRCSRWALFTRATGGASGVGQVGDLARVVHAQFDHRRLVRGGAGATASAATTSLLKVALRGQGRIPARAAGGQHLRDGGPCRCCRSRLSAADQTGRARRAPARPGPPGVGHLMPAVQPVGLQPSRAPRRPAFRQKNRVETLAGRRRTGRCSVRVSGARAQRRPPSPTRRRAVEGGCPACCRHGVHAAMPRRASACARCHVGETAGAARPSPGNPRGPCRRSAPRRWRQPRRRPGAWPIGTVLLLRHMGGGNHALPDLVDDGAGSSPRGLSLVTMTRSASRRHGAHQRALGGVAVAATAEHAPQPAATRCAAMGAAPQRLVQRVGRVGVVHGHQGWPAKASTAACARHGCQARAGLPGSCAKGTPSARMPAITPSRLETLYRPISWFAAAGACRPRPR